MDPRGAAQRRSCCVLDAWGEASAFLQPPWVFTYATFHKVIQRSPKNLKLIKFHPKLDSPRFVSRVIQMLLVTCRSLTPGRISVFYKQMWNAASALGQAIAVACMKTTHQAAEPLQGWTGGRPKGNLLRREKKGLQVLVRNYWQSFREMCYTEYWLNTEHDPFVFWSFVGSCHICRRSTGALLAF